MFRWWKLSLRTKLAITLGVATLLPLLLVSAVGIRVAIGRLERSLLIQTRQTAHIALNLLLRQVQRISKESIHLAADPELHELLNLDPGLVSHYLQTHYQTSDLGLIEVADKHKTIFARWLPQDQRRYRRLFCRSGCTASVKALNYEQYLTIALVGNQLVIQAAAPIIDATFALRGAVIITAPLDGQMADYIKGVVRADIGFLNGNRPVASTFVSQTGQRILGVSPPQPLEQSVLQGNTIETVQQIEDQEFAMAFAPLQTIQGKRIGMLAVGLSREGLMHAKFSATRSLIFGGIICLIFAMSLAYVIGRRITIPLGRLHRSTQAIAAGDLEHGVTAETDDEIGDLARAFQTMTVALRENQERLAARMREIMTLHQIGRAVSSVLSLDQVLHLVVNEVTNVIGAERGVLMLLEDNGQLHLRAEVGLYHSNQALCVPNAWLQMAEEVTERHAAKAVTTTLAVPLETREQVLGALVIARREGAGSFSEADLRLLMTFADQAATAIANARLYDEIRTFSAELEEEVQRRTAELVATNAELERTISELKQTQAMLIHSERMAGLGLLVAGIAHEINTPAGAIQGSAQTFGETIDRLVERLRQFTQCRLTPKEASSLFEQMIQGRRALSQIGRLPPATIRHRARELATIFERYQILDSQRLSKRLLEAGAAEMAESIGQLADRVSPELAVGIVEDLAFLERSSLSIQAAISSLVRLVSALKSYAHTDEKGLIEADITEGLETTLTILHNQLRYGITVQKSYDPLPKVPAYVDELNQVWTNLIHNSIQAMDGKGEIEITTFMQDDWIGVRVQDNGPGIPPEIMPRIFEPFFTTKPSGVGSGLGLGIAYKIVKKHGGKIEVESRPNCTCFTVLLPKAGPQIDKKSG